MKGGARSMRGRGGRVSSCRWEEQQGGVGSIGPMSGDS